MTKSRIAVLTGGYSAEANISHKSANTVIHHLDANLFETYLIDISKEKWVHINNNKTEFSIDKNDFSLSINHQKINFDMVFFALHGTPAEDGKIQGYFDMMGIKYCGANMMEMALTFDKAATKKYLKCTDILMADSFLYHKHEDTTSIVKHISTHLKMPVFVKPNKNGSSYGVTKVSEISGLEAAVINGFEYDDELIVEAFISGREMTCGVYQFDGVLKALSPTEIKSQNDFFDYKAKYLGESQEITPAEISKELTSKIQEISIKAFKELGLKGHARMDFILHDDAFYFLEANTIPGLTDESLIPQQVVYDGWTLKDFFTAIIQEGFRKYKGA